MKKITLALLFVLSMTMQLFAQKPEAGQLLGERIPLVCGSTGNSSADSTRLPILFQARINGLTPGAKYKYYTRFIVLSDTASTTTTGAGMPLVIRKNGSWSSILSPNLGVPGAHDTIALGLGQSDYVGWFGAIYDNDSRFTPGNYVYPMIIMQEIDTIPRTITKAYINDSIQVLQFSNVNSSNKGTSIFGASSTRFKSMILLYTQSNGMTTRPVSITYAENEGLSFSKMQTYYNNKINGVSGSWGTIIPNAMSTGITRIESRDPGFDTVIYANIETDGIWGNDSTINRSGGAKRPVYIKNDYAPLMRPEFEFVTTLLPVNEANTTVGLVFRRKYGNTDSSKVSAFVTTSTATSGADYTFLSTNQFRFKPYGEATDTIKVKIFDDLLSEPLENIVVRLNNPVNARLGAVSTSTINIIDNDICVISFAKPTQTVKESQGLLKVKVKITNGSVSTTSFHVAVKSKSDSTLIPADFKLGSTNKDTTISFTSGKLQDSLEFNIRIIDEQLKEDRPDTIVLALRNPTSPSTFGKDSLYTLIITDNDAAPIYSFSTKALTVNENVGSVKMRINRLGGNSNQSDIILSALSSAGLAQPGSDYTFSSQLLSFSGTDPDSFIYTLPIINDNTSEMKEDAVFIIRTSFNAKIAKPDTIRISIIDNDLPEYKINKVSTCKAPAFVVDSLNVRCALRGVVYGVNLGPLGTPNGLTFTLIDNTGGIQVLKPSGGTFGYNVTEGDSVLVYGRIAQSNGMVQLTQLDTLYKLASNRTLRSAKLLGILGETTESDLVKFNLVKLSNPNAWPSTAMAPNTTVTLKVKTASDSFDMVIDSETDIDGKPAPTGFFNLTGIGAQLDASSPFNSGYRIMPRRMADVVNLVVPVFNFTAPTSSAIENRDSTNGFTLQCANLSSNQQITLYIKSGTASRNVDYQSNASRMFILTPSVPSIVVKSKLNDDATVELNETIVWVIRDNSWGTVIGPDSIHTVTIIDDESNSILENALAAKIKMYPNPANELVRFKSESAVIQQISIFDVNARLVQTIVLEANQEQSISVAGLSKGIYQIHIDTDKGRVIKPLSVQ